MVKKKYIVNDLIKRDNQTESEQNIWTIEAAEREGDEKQHTYEEAIQEAGNGRYQLFLLLVCGSCIMSVASQSTLLGFALPAARCDLKFTVREQGILNSVGFIGIAVSSHFWGFMADTWGRIKVLRIALSISFLFAVLSSFSKTVPMLIVTRFFVGLFISGVQGSAFSYLGEFHCNKSRVKSVTMAAMFMPLAILFLPSLSWLIISFNWKIQFLQYTYEPWQLLILLSSVVNVFAFTSFLFLPESAKYLLSMGKKEEALEILRNVYVINKRRPIETYKIKELLCEDIGSNLDDNRGFLNICKLLWTQTSTLFKRQHIKNTLGMSFLMFILFSISQGTFLWMPQIFSAMIHYIDDNKTLCEIMKIELTKPIVSNQSSNANEECTAVVDPLTYQSTLVVGIISACLFVFLAVFIDRIGRKKLLSVWLTLSAISCLSVIWSSNFYLTSILVIFYISAGLIGSVLNAISVDLFPTNIRAMALCLILIFARVGSVAGNNFLGALLTVQCSLIFIIYAGFLLFCVVIILIL